MASRVTRRLALLVFLGLLVSSMAATPVWANGIGGTNSECSSMDWCYHYRSHQTYYYVGLPPAWETESDWARTQNINPTDMSTAMGDVLADVEVHHNDYAANWYGVTLCDVSSGNECSQWNVHFNSQPDSEAPGFTYTQQQKRSLACHEFGHSTGLHHYANHVDPSTCMETPHWHTSYNQHGIDHINDSY